MILFNSNHGKMHSFKQVMPNPQLNENFLSSYPAADQTIQTKQTNLIQNYVAIANFNTSNSKVTPPSVSNFNEHINQQHPFNTICHLNKNSVFMENINSPQISNENHQSARIENINFQYRDPFGFQAPLNYQNFYPNYQSSQPILEYKTIENNKKNSIKAHKKSRVLFSQWQINELEKLFKKQKYVTSNERDLMAKRLKLHANQVKIWFQNRRYKIKKKNEQIKGENQPNLL